MVDFRANAAKGLSMSNPGAIFDAMKNGINYMADRVAQLVECCGSAARQSCDCGWSFEDVREYTITKDFFNISATVLPVESTQDTACICWNIISQDQEIHNLDSGMVYLSTNVDEIIFTEEFQFEVSELYQILIDIGVKTNERRQTFFGAITDQYVFCEGGEEPPVTFRSMTLNLKEIQEQLAAVDLGIWFNVLHFNGIAMVSILSKGMSKEELGSIFSSECLNKATFAECAFTRLAYYYHNSPGDMPVGFANVISGMKPIDLYSLYNLHRRSHFNPKYLRWFVETSIEIDTTISDNEIEFAEVFESHSFYGPYISDQTPACPNLIVWARIVGYPEEVSRQYGAAINKIALELPFPESFDGPKIYMGGYWRFNSFRQLLFPPNHKENLSSITAEAINKARHEIVKHVIEHDGHFGSFNMEIGGEKTLIQPSIWEYTEYWGYPISRMISDLGGRGIHRWLNYPNSQRSATFTIHLTEHSQAQKYPEINIIIFEETFSNICR